MPVPIEIIGERDGHLHRVRVSHVGELIVGPFAFSQVAEEILDADNVVENIILPSPGQEIVLTGYSIGANKDVGPDGAEFSMFEADSLTSATSTRDLLNLSLARNATQTLPLNVLVTQGQWVNAVTDDNNVNVTLFFYYRPVDPHLVGGAP